MVLTTQSSSSADLKGRVELYVCSPSGPSWAVTGRTVPFSVIIVYRGVQALKYLSVHSIVCVLSDSYGDGQYPGHSSLFIHRSSQVIVVSFET